MAHELLHIMIGRHTQWEINHEMSTLSGLRRIEKWQRAPLVHGPSSSTASLPNKLSRVESTRVHMEVSHEMFTLSRFVGSR